MISQIIGAVLAAFAVNFFESRGRCHGPPTGDVASSSCGVSIHLRAYLRCVEHRYGEGYVRQLILRAGNRIHGDGVRVFRREHFRRGVQPRGRGGDLLYRAVVLAEYLDLSRRRFCWRCSGSGRAQGGEPKRRISGPVA